MARDRAKDEKIEEEEESGAVAVDTAEGTEEIDARGKSEPTWTGALQLEPSKVVTPPWLPLATQYVALGQEKTPAAPVDATALHVPERRATKAWS